MNKNELNNLTDFEFKKERRRKSTIIKSFIISLTVIFVIIGTLIVEKNHRTDDESQLNSVLSNTSEENLSSDFIDEDKYAAYIDFNNDIVNCYNYTINLYIKSKGAKENVEHKYSPDRLDMAPILVYPFDRLNKVKSVVNKSPITSLDKKAADLIEPVENVYNIANQLYYAYGGNYNEYIPEVDKSKTKEELHKDFLAAICELDPIFNDFKDELNNAEKQVEIKELERYKKIGDMDSYETLNIFIESRKLYEYLADNAINDDNIFDMDIEEYKSMLQDYNKAYEEFKKQNITGTCHSTSFKEEAANFNNLANNIVRIVEEKNINAGEPDKPHGLKVSGEIKSINEQLFELLQEMTSSYNSIISFKNN